MTDAAILPGGRDRTQSCLVSHAGVSGPAALLQPFVALRRWRHRPDARKTLDPAWIGCFIFGNEDPSACQLRTCMRCARESDQYARIMA